MFVSKIGFIVSISRNLKFGAAEMIQSHKSRSLRIGTKGVEALCTKRGVWLHTLLVDNQF
jgi:hypothetical protein